MPFWTRNEHDRLSHDTEIAGHFITVTIAKHSADDIKWLPSTWGNGLFKIGTIVNDITPTGRLQSVKCKALRIIFLSFLIIIEL
jgi:hypothetical protein